MTLATYVGFEEYTDPREFLDWINENLLRVTDPVIEVSGPDHKWWSNTVANQIGQGFDAWVMVRHNQGDLYVWDDDPYYENYPNLRVFADFDTAYGYSGPGGIGCTQLHAGYIQRIVHDFAAPRGYTTWWRNEFTGDWFKGTDGLMDFR